ncbi:MAG: 4Fe-4S cluster-binding domain-containing protein, partial [Microbacterium sp.]
MMIVAESPGIPEHSALGRTAPPAASAERLRWSRFLPATRAEGPGLRAAIWVQGCAVHCPECFNPHL